MQDQTNEESRRAEYDTYLLSPAWQAKRQVALQRAGHRCQLCNSSKQLDVHHRTYERFKNEIPGDLTVLCRKCHDCFHTERRPSKSRKASKSAEAMSKQQIDLLLLVRQARFKEGFTTRDIATELGATTQTTGPLLAALRKRKILRRRPDGRWELVASAADVATREQIRDPRQPDQIIGDVLRTMRQDRENRKATEERRRARERRERKRLAA